MNVNDARIVGDQVKCWNCPCTLGQIVSADALRLTRPDRLPADVRPTDRVILAAQPVYRSAAVPPIAAAAGMRAILVVPRRVQDRLARTGLGWTRRRKLDGSGAAKVQPSVFVAMPAIMPCWRPGCGEPNRVVDIGDATGA